MAESRNRKPLTDTEVRAIKGGPKVRKLSDGGGLFLQVETNGSRLWRFSYRWEGKQRTISFGAYPYISLAEARTRRQEAKTMLAHGVDPSPRRRAALEAASAAPPPPKATFADMAAGFRAKREMEGASPATLDKLDWIIGLLAPHIGALGVRDVKPADVLAALKVIEAQGKRETAGRMRSTAGQVFRYALAHGECDSDPTRDLRDALAAPVTRHRAGLTDPKKVGTLIRAIRGYEGMPSIRAALLFLAYQFPRPGELRFMEWGDVDLEAARVRIPAARMKMRRDHILPLSRQSVALLRALHPITGRGPYVFAGSRGQRPMSENTLNATLRILGFGPDSHVAHGFRTTASTNLNEQGWNADWIERQLAHVPANKVRGAYNAAEFLEGRAKMMQAWADWLDAREKDCPPA